MFGWIIPSLPEPALWPSIGIGAAGASGILLALHLRRWIKERRTRAQLISDPVHWPPPQVPGLSQGPKRSLWNFASALWQLPVAAIFGGTGVWYFLADEASTNDVRLWMAICGLLVAVGMLFDRMGKLSQPYEASEEYSTLDEDPEVPAFLKGQARGVTFALAAIAWAALMLTDTI